MANSYVGNDDWGEENNSSPSTVEQAKTSAQRGSWEDEKVLEGENKLEQLRRNLVDIHTLQDDFNKSASELNETTKETKLMTRDMLEAVPHVRKIGENLMALTKVIKDDFTNVPLSVSPESYDTVKTELNGRINAILDTAVEICTDRIKGIINEERSEGMQKADRVEKHLEEIFERFTEKMSANTQARLDLLQKKIDKKEMKIKQLEQKSGGIFLTDKQFAFMIVLCAFMLVAAVLGLSTTVKRDGASILVVVILCIGLTSNLILYVLRYAWKGIKWLWNHISGNND